MTEKSFKEPGVEGWMLLVILGISPILYVWQGFALSVIWGWFLVPLGVPVITTVNAAGILVIVNFITARWSKDNDKNMMDKIMFSFFLPVVTLAFGYIIQLFM